MSEDIIIALDQAFDGPTGYFAAGLDPDNQVGFKSLEVGVWPPVDGDLIYKVTMLKTGLQDLMWWEESITGRLQKVSVVIEDVYLGGWKDKKTGKKKYNALVHERLSGFKWMLMRMVQEELGLTILDPMPATTMYSLVHVKPGNKKGLVDRAKEIINGSLSGQVPDEEREKMMDQVGEHSADAVCILYAWLARRNRTIMEEMYE
jgi:hypothetical protein